MGLDLWFREDCARILAATQETMTVTMNANTALDPAQAEAYRQGFSDATRAVAVAFGVVAPTPSGDNGQRREMRIMDAEPPQLRNGWR